MYDIRDLVPWSLVYGAQNERHDDEMSAMKHKIYELEQALNKMCIHDVKKILLSCPLDFNDKTSGIWSNLELIKTRLTLADIRSILGELIAEYKDIQEELSLRGNIFITYFNV